MLFLSHQEPPPQPPATAQIVQKSQEAAALGLRPHGSLIGPPKSLMSGAKIDFKKFSERLYVEVVVIEGQTEPLLKKPVNYMVTLPDGRIIWHRQQRNDLKYARMIPFWMDNVYGVGHNSRGGPLGRNTRFVPFPFPLVQQY